MAWTRSGTAALIVAGMMWASGAPALAATGWGWPVEGAVSAPFGSRYVSEQGVDCTHGGVDIRADAGATVRACSAGEVVFSGRVPAGEGEQAWAVTVLTVDGLRVTYLPLRRGSVAKGARVDQGAALGELEATGDASSATAHLHLGVRRGETRLDPESLLGARGAAPERASAPAPVAAPVPGAAPHPASPAPHASAPGREAPAPHGAPAPAPIPSPAPAHVPARAGASALAPSAPAVLPFPALPVPPVLRRVPQVADPTLVRSSEVAADVTSLRDVLAAVLARLGLVGLVVACVWPVLRKTLAVQAGRVPATVAVRRHGA